MDAELLQALAAEVADQMNTLRADMRRERAAETEVMRRSVEVDNAALCERQADTAHRLELAQAELAVLRAAAQDGPVAALTLDAGGTVRLVQRQGPALEMALPDVQALVEHAVDHRLAAAREALETELQARLARTAELFFNPPAWSAGTVYMEGQIVTTDVGRTYRVRAGVRAAAGREPAEDPARWERLGTGGFRVFKSKPLALQAGDMFAEHDARFVHDGQTTTLLVPKVPKTSDIERAGKAGHGLAQAAEAHNRDQDQQIAAQGEAIARTQAAANDASECSVQALAATEELRNALEAVREVVERLQAAGGSKTS